MRLGHRMQEEEIVAEDARDVSRPLEQRWNVGALVLNQDAHTERERLLERGANAPESGDQVAHAVELLPRERERLVSVGGRRAEQQLETDGEL